MHAWHGPLEQTQPPVVRPRVVVFGIRLFPQPYVFLVIFPPVSDCIQQTTMSNSWRSTNAYIQSFPWYNEAIREEDLREVLSSNLTITGDEVGLSIPFTLNLKSDWIKGMMDKIACRLVESIEGAASNIVVSEIEPASPETSDKLVMALLLLDRTLYLRFCPNANNVELPGPVPRPPDVKPQDVSVH